MKFNEQVFFKGFVENNKDPLKMGRLQIRVLGLHTKKLVKTPVEGIPTSELPWANPAHPITSTSVNDIGTWSVPVQGSWVWCFPEDQDLQRWVYFATISGRPVEGPGGEGFHDPDGEYPQIVNEPDFNRLASNQNIGETIIPIKIAEKLKAVPIASAGTWEEPQEPYAAEYPYNTVIETQRKGFLDGHLIELDDTPGEERIHFWHKVGSWFSIHKNGQMVRRSTHDDYTIIRGDQYNYIDTNQYITVADDRRVLVLRNLIEETVGSVKIYIAKNKLENIGGDYELNVGADVESKSKPSMIVLDKSKVLVEANVLKEKLIYYEEGKEEQRSISDIPGSAHSLELNPSITSAATSKGQGDFVQDVKRDKKTHTHRDIYEYGDSNRTIIIEKKHDEIINGVMYVSVMGTTGTGDLIVYAAGDEERTVDGDMYVEVGGHIDIDAGGQITMRGGDLLTSFGCVHGGSICPFTISPHIQPSATVEVSF